MAPKPSGSAPRPTKQQKAPAPTPEPRFDEKRQLAMAKALRKQARASRPKDDDGGMEGFPEASEGRD